MVSSVVAVLADGLVIPIVIVATLALLVYVPRSKKVSMYSRMLVAGLTSYMVAKFMSLIYQPSPMRPFEMAGVTPGASYLDNPGFPSDHALFVWVIVLAVAYAVPYRKWLWMGLSVLALLVCLGRVFALVHAPIDIIGGMFAALVGGLWYLNEKKFAKNTKVV